MRAVDNGVDIVLDNGTTLQVKTLSRPIDDKRRHKQWRVNFLNTAWKKGKIFNRTNNIKADIIVIWIIPEDTFYIIPANIMKDKLGLTITPEATKSIFNQYKNDWNLLSRMEVKET